MNKDEIEKAKSNILRGNDIESACLIMEAVVWDGLVQVGGRVNITKVAMRQILNFIEEYKNKGSLDIIREKVQANERAKQLENKYETNYKIRKTSRINNLYKAEYIQNPFNILTKENLESLEEHCKKTIHYERGKAREEHEIILELLNNYKEQKEDIMKKDKIIKHMAKDCYLSWTQAEYKLFQVEYNTMPNITIENIINHYMKGV